MTWGCKVSGSNTYGSDINYGVLRPRRLRTYSYHSMSNKKLSVLISLELNRAFLKMAVDLTTFWIFFVGLTALKRVTSVMKLFESFRSSPAFGSQSTWCFRSFCCLSLRESVNDTTPGSRRSHLLPPFARNYDQDPIEDDTKPNDENEENNGNDGLPVHNSGQLCTTFYS